MKKFKGLKKTRRFKNFNTQEISEGIFLVCFKTSKEMMQTTLRFTEIENPLFSPCSPKKFKSCFKNVYGDINPSNQWDGFCIPSKDLDGFYEGEWNPLTIKEKSFLNQFKNINKEFCVIVICSESESTTLKHELVHAFYTLKPKYRRKVKKILKRYNMNPIFNILKSEGYEESMLIDEANAVLTHNLFWLKTKGLKTYKNYYKLCGELNALFEEFS